MTLSTPSTPFSHSSHSGCSITHYTCGDCPTVTDTLLHFLMLFPLAFRFGRFPLANLQAVLLLVTSSPPLSPSKAFIPITEILISRISIWLLLRVSNSPLMSPVCPNIWLTFPIRALSILIIAILNSWSDNSKCHALSESVSDVCFVSVSRPSV